MKKLLFLSLLFLNLVFTNAQTKLYLHPDADKYSKKTKSIAILPLDVQVKLRPKQLKDFTSEQIDEMEKKEALDIQKGMHTWFLTRKKRNKFSKKIAVANKESIICGWSLIQKELVKNRTEFVPVDSEHFSLWYGLQGFKTNNIEKIYLTASGGPFYKTPLKDFKKIKKTNHEKTHINTNYLDITAKPYKTNNSEKGDIYSLAIIFLEMIYYSQEEF